ncbi:MAG TPA: pitrilysin family protein [Symbiobacteriaceae bacterium]|nr:pitrilysin family protein [Symbiobacteriaceae bacterium]
MTFFQKTVLPNGLRVITERIPHVRSVSLGVWVAAGSRLERPDQAGIAHLIEHMLFKGTTNRSAREISSAIDGRGGTLNAFTAKEHTCFYARCLDEHLPIAVDLLDDMLRHSLLDPTELGKEKGVVCEEIKMYEDVPDDLVHDLFVGELWPDHPLGRPIAGTMESVRSFERADLLGYMDEHYRDDQIVISASGNLEHDWLVERVQALTNGAQRPPRPIEWGPPPVRRQQSSLLLRRKEIEQVHLVLGAAGLAHGHEESLTLQLLSCVLGGGSSSRLFQEIREKRGLAYSVYSYQSSFRDAGNYGVYAACSPAQAEEVLALIHAMVGEVSQQGITEAELVEAKAQLKGQLMLGLESTSARMSRLGRNELSQGYVLSADEVMARIDAVTVQGARSLAAEIFSQPWILSVVGPVPADFESRAVVKEVLGVG